LAHEEHLIEQSFMLIAVVYSIRNTVQMPLQPLQLQLQLLVPQVLPAVQYKLVTLQ
jgi:hypothetical protein